MGVFSKVVLMAWMVSLYMHAGPGLEDRMKLVTDLENNEDDRALLILISITGVMGKGFSQK